ncbi:MAG: hypothetical protein C6I00_05810 [Nitratiruptor sp.]|nr:hypothetical protein [Nitratiruptor sp.]NPA83614.1 hypothetical protein [Campylobacterota bacterium]
MKLALALSGGGARCAAQLGYLEPLINELGITIEAYSGSSGGGIAAALLAKGYHPREALQLLLETDYSKIAWDLRRGIWNLEPMEVELHRLGLDRFDRLTAPLTITLTRFHDLTTHYRSQGDLARTLLAGAALIPLFAPITIDGVLFCDGGLSDNLPVTPLRSTRKEPILAINVNPRRLPFPNTIRGNLKRAAMALFNSNIHHSIPKATYYVEIQECGEYGILERSKLAQIYGIGQKAAYQDLRLWEQRCGSDS